MWLLTSCTTSGVRQIHNSSESSRQCQIVLSLWAIHLLTFVSTRSNDVWLVLSQKLLAEVHSEALAGGLIRR